MYMFNKRLQESKSKDYSAKDFLESINRCTAFPQPVLASFGEFQFRTFSLDFSRAFKAEKRFVLQNTYHSRPIQKYPLKLMCQVQGHRAGFGSIVIWIVNYWSVLFF